MRRTTPEAAVQADCLRLLEIARWPHWRANSGVAWLPGRGGKRRPVRFNERGCSDILGVVPRSGRFLAIECKSPEGDRPTGDQRAFLANVARAGGVALVVRDAAHLQRAINLLTADPWAHPGGEEDFS